MSQTVKFKPVLAFRRATSMVGRTLFILGRNFRALRKDDVPMPVVKSWHNMMCHVGGIEVVCEGAPIDRSHVMFVSNHVSYIDIPVMGSVLDAWFVAKSEVRGWPGFGYLAKVGKTVFIERRSRRAGDQRNQLADLLATGKNLILFPEGTSTDGTDVVGFKPTLFEAAFQDPLDGDVDDIWVQPFSIRYVKYNGAPLSDDLRDRYAWYGDMTLADHFIHWLGLGTIQVCLKFHPAVSRRDFADRKLMARHCENVIREDVIQQSKDRVSQADKTDAA